jgi:hypothetical protein
MDCSDKEVFGPFDDEAAAREFLLSKDTDLAYGDTFDSAKATIVVGEDKDVVIGFDRRGGREFK